MSKGGKGWMLFPLRFKRFFSNRSYISPCYSQELFVRHLDTYLFNFSSFRDIFCLKHSDFGVYFVAQTNFAFHFTHTKTFGLVRCASDRTKQFCSAGLYILDLLCVHNCRFDVGSRTIALN